MWLPVGSYSSVITMMHGPIHIKIILRFGPQDVAENTVRLFLCVVITLSWLMF